MQDAFACPVCSGERWRTIEVFEWRRAEREDASLSEADRWRRWFMFRVWLPDADSVRLRSLLCRSCGFVTYAPRPTAADIELKYSWLRGSGDDVGGSSDTAEGRRMDRGRAERIHSALRRRLGVGRPRILDFGGGDGKLLMPFVEEGARCAVLDYNPNPLPGIERLGDTLGDLADDARFDAVVCSHVLEHVAEPRELLSGLAGHLEPGGVLYAEVPVELWRGTPVGVDPITHVNFLTRATLEQLAWRSGLRVVEAANRRGSYGAAPIEVAAIVGERPAGPAPEVPAPSPREAELRLEPDLSTEIRRAWRMRRVPSARGVARRFRPSG